MVALLLAATQAHALEDSNFNKGLAGIETVASQFSAIPSVQSGGLAAEAVPAAAKDGSIAPSFKKVMIIILENGSYSEAITQNFLGNFAKQGALFTNFDAETHPSQPNYIALTAGTTKGVSSDSPVNLNEKNLADLLEAKGLTWKVYAQDYPGNCYTGTQSGNYVRKHVPFISYTNIQKDAKRCANITTDAPLASDITNGTLPDFSLFIPNIKNDGHDTGIPYADKWLTSYFAPLMQNQAFMKDMLLVVSFDEDDKSTSTNRIYTAFYGNMVTPGSTSNMSYNHYSLLRTIEDNFALGNLGQNDASASPITGVWR